MLRTVAGVACHPISPGTKMVDLVGFTPLPYAILSNQIMPDTAQIVVKVVVDLDCDQACMVTGEEGIYHAPLPVAGLG